jgi:extracellular elastinolytic metalloproteinase
MSPPRGDRVGRVVTATLVGFLALILGLPSASSASGRSSAQSQHRVSTFLTGHSIAPNLDLLGRPVALPDYEGAAVRIAPTAAQLQAVRALGAHASWTKYGTVASLIRYGRTLSAARQGSAASVARSFVAQHRALFRLSAAGVNALRVISNTTFEGSSARVVLFRQSFGGLPAGQDGMITVGLNEGAVYYVSSSSAGDQALTNQVALTPLQAWLAAAANVGRSVSPSAVHAGPRSRSWSTFAVTGFAQPQRVRLRAFPTVDQGARAAYETIVEDVRGGRTMAYTEYVDAQTGAVLFRQNDVDQLAAVPAALMHSTAAASPNGGEFDGTFAADACSDPNPLPTSSTDKSIVVVANADQVENDILLNLLNPQGQVVASSDEATSPEAVTYTFPSTAPDSAPFYSAQVCPSPNPLGPFVEPFTYHGGYVTSDQEQPDVSQTAPEWKYFENSPKLDYSSSDTRVTGCWVIPATSGGAPLQHHCSVRVNSRAAQAPWDFEVRSNAPTFATTGNQAQTRQAWASPLTPGPLPVGPEQPHDADRTYGFNDQTFTPPGENWTNSWYTNKCDPTAIANPATNDADVLASVTNLFAGHNRMHDWSYRLGFTEQHYNLQQDNFGRTSPAHENDPEVGDVQAGAFDGGAPSYEGRDNANQITLNDGVPGITNQYLFQPIAGAFYAPCVDGSYDFEVFGHEYTHAISNRMVGGPDSGLTGQQAGSMGESWSDQDALEYLHEYDLFLPGQNPWALGPYATGNEETGIRNYSLDHDPLQYGDIGYDIPGAEVHADGEIWSAVAYDIRHLMAKRWDSKFPESDTELQAFCANSREEPDECPGNRRWIYDVYHGFLLMQPSVSMLDARDAYLAADLMKFGTNPRANNQAQLWLAFAQNGFGEDAFSEDSNDVDPIPGYVDPLVQSGTVVFNPVAVNQGNAAITSARFFVGDYEARVTPSADTIPNTESIDDRMQMVPGTYAFVAQAPGFGLRRFHVKVVGGHTTTVQVPMKSNWASLSSGAEVNSSDASACAGGTPPAECGLIDDTEATDWSVTTTNNVNVDKPSVTVHLATPRTIRSAVVSALVHAGQSRFDALRQFELQACDSSKGADCSQGESFHTVFTSPADAFPAGIPRPLAPNLIFRSFAVTPFHASDVRFVVLDNQCTGAPAYQDPNDQMDNDPSNPTDCPTGSSEGMTADTAELELFS